MNAKRLALVIVLAATSAHAIANGDQSSLSDIYVTAPSRLIVDCSSERLPTLRALGAVLDSNNATYVYAARERLRHFAHRACMRGASSITFERDDSTPVPVLAMVDTAP